MHTSTRHWLWSAVIFLLIATITIVHQSHASVNSNEGCVGNLIWFDQNKNGVKDEAEFGLDSLEVTLTRSSENHKVVVARAVTLNGYFNLCSHPGSYEINLSIPPEYSVTQRDTGEDDYHDSDANDLGIIDNVVISADRKIDKFDIGLVSDAQNIDTVNINDHVFLNPDDKNFNFGPWVEYRHRHQVFRRFNSALLWSPPEEIIQILKDAKETNTKLILQLGSAAAWGWDFDENKSNFTIEKWYASTARFVNNDRIHAAISQAVSDDVIRSFYIIDEPHHTRWSPSGSDSNYITNLDLDAMAAYIKKEWPDASTSVRASPRSLVAYGRGAVKWKHLDEAFVMINYKKWSSNGLIRTIEGFISREIRAANQQNLSIIASVQMLIGAPENSRWWDETDIGQPRPVGKLSVSPEELRTYINHFTKSRNKFGYIDSSGSNYMDTIMVFRWDRNDESDWNDHHYDKVINELIHKSNGTTLKP